MKNKKNLVSLKKSCTFATAFPEKNGVLAQVARAFDWQSKGHRFDSDILHQRGSDEPLFLFYNIRKFNVLQKKS